MDLVFLRFQFLLILVALSALLLPIDWTLFWFPSRMGLLGKDWNVWSLWWGLWFRITLKMMNMAINQWVASHTSKCQARQAITCAPYATPHATYSTITVLCYFENNFCWLQFWFHWYVYPAFWSTTDHRWLLENRTKQELWKDHEKIWCGTRQQTILTF